MSKIFNLFKSRYIIIGMLVCLFIPIISAQNGMKYGLHFKAYDYIPESRTSLVLTPEDYFAFKTGFSISFDLLVHTDLYSYGYIFRMIDKNENHFDLLLSKGNLVFLSSMSDDIRFQQKVKFNQWVHVKIDIDAEKEELTICIDDKNDTWQETQIKHFKEVYIAFGKNEHSKIHAIDVATVTIKDLKISDMLGEPIYYWRLSKYAKEGVYDEIEHRFAKCENPSWIIDENGHWGKLLELISGRNPYIAFNPDKHEIAIADTSFFYRYNINTNHLDKKKISSGLSFPMYANQMIYNELDSNYYAYNIVKEEDGRELAMFDIETGKWAKTTPHHFFSDYWYHNRYFSMKYNKLYLFGGYGHHKYKRDAYVYDLSTELWSKVLFKGDAISPRYLSGIGRIDDGHLLLFGGYGSESGNQESFPQFYYDAYIVNLETMEAKRIWTLDTPNEHFVVSNSLVVDTANNCFYALCFSHEKSNSRLSLNKFYIDRPKYELVADQIPFRFTDRNSYADLFFDKELGKLIVVKYSSEAKNSKANVSFFTLAYPPLKQSDLYQTDKEETGLIFILVIVLVTGGIICSLFYIKKQHKAKNVDVITKLSDDESNPILGVSTVKQLRKQSIYLLGGFRVINKYGNEITGEFMPLFIQLFLLILLYTIKDGKGVPFTRMKDILWPDKTEESANNNRGYVLSKMRQILENVGEIKFSKQNLCWGIKLGKDIYCDYYECLILMQQLKNKENRNLQDIQRLLSIVSTGDLLPDLQTEWLDSFKADFANELIDLLLDIMCQKEFKMPLPMKIEISNAIFVHDTLNEDALQIKCICLVEMGKNGLAKNIYNSFMKEYKEWFGVEYKFTFEQLLNSRAF